ncbi:MULTISPECIES: glycosyltransferase family 4 protein [Methylosinus]|nr:MULTISPECIES: glycosyltransferase family 4 protein [Methylosinus]
MRSARVLALLTDGFGASGGIARFNADLLTALDHSPHVGSVVALPRHAGASGAALAKIVQLPPSPRRARWALRATTLCARRRFDLLFCGHLAAAPLAAALSAATGARLWIEAHGVEAWTDPGEATRRAVARADLVTTVSRYTRRRLLDWADMHPSRVRVLPNVAPPRAFARERRADLVARYGLENRKTVLTVGRLAATERYKGHDRVIAALPDVVAQCATVVYLIVGAGGDEMRLRRAADAAGVADRVIFAGHVDDGELPDHFALADVFAMPSDGEGFGIVFLEAARAGLEIIGGDRDGSADALADGAIGRMIDPFDHARLVEALVLALTKSRPSRPTGAVDRFCFEHFAERVDDLLHCLD